MPPRVPVMVIAAVVVAALSGCTAAVPAKTVVTNPIPTPTPLQLTGTALKAALLPTSDFPAGSAINTKYTQDSGPSLLPGTPSPTPSPRNCQQLLAATTLPSTGVTARVDEVLYDTTVDHPTIYRQRRYGQFVFQFAEAADATAYLDAMRAAVIRCPSVTTTTKSVKVIENGRMTATPPVAGHQAYLLRQWGSGGHDTFTSEELFTIDGTDVYLIGQTVFGLPLTTRMSLPALTAKLIASVRARS